MQLVGAQFSAYYNSIIEVKLNPLLKEMSNIFRKKKSDTDWNTIHTKEADLDLIFSQFKLVNFVVKVTNNFKNRFNIIKSI